MIQKYGLIYVDLQFECFDIRNSKNKDFPDLIMDLYQ